MGAFVGSGDHYYNSKRRLAPLVLGTLTLFGPEVTQLQAAKQEPIPVLFDVTSDSVLKLWGAVGKGNCGTLEPIVCPAEGHDSSGKRTNSVVVNGAVIGLDFLDSPEFAVYFPGRDYEPGSGCGDEDGKNAYCGAFIIRQDRRTGEGSAIFWFHALGDDGKTDIEYRLEMDAAISPEDSGFPLMALEGYTVELTNFVLLHESGGKKQARPCEKDFGDAGPTATVTIEQR